MSVTKSHHKVSKLTPPSRFSTTATGLWKNHRTRPVDPRLDHTGLRDPTPERTGPNQCYLTREQWTKPMLLNQRTMDQTNDT